jgi:hypothetical protein
MEEWQRSMPKLLELAVSHELGHALCAEPNEAAAIRFGKELRNGGSPACQLPKAPEKKSFMAGRTPRGKPGAFGLR